MHWAGPMPQSSSRTDEALIAAAQAQDAAAMAELLVRYELRLRRRAERLCMRGEDADEVLQDTMLQIIRTIHQFRGECAFMTWASAVARSQVSRYRRRNARERNRREAVSAVVHGVPDFLNCASPNPEVETADAELRKRIRDALDALAPMDRRVFALRQLRGRSAPEVAEELGLTVPAVKSRLHRARRELRASLSGLHAESIGLDDCISA